MASCSRAGGSLASGRSPSRTRSIRSVRSRVQGAKPPSCIVFGVGAERLQHALLEDLDLLLGILQRVLAVREELGAALVGGKRFLERKLTGLHRCDEGFELGERGFETRRLFGGHGLVTSGRALDLSSTDSWRISFHNIDLHAASPI